MPSFAIQAPNLRYFGPVIEAEVMPTSFDAANVQASGDPLPHPVRERDAWVDHMLASIDEVGIPEPHRSTMREYFERAATFMMNQPT